MKTKIAGIPCEVRVTYSTPYTAARTLAAPENCYPEEGGDIEFEVLDRRGRPAPWLERKMTQKMRSEIESQLQGDKHG